MRHWLIKSEPNCYSFDELMRDRTTVWDGIRNALAQKYLRQMSPGDRVMMYHTGNVRAIMGTAKVITPPRLDGKLSVVDIEAGDPLSHPVTLAQIKSDPAFAQWELVRMARLSVMPVPADLWERILTLSKEPANLP